MPRELLHIYGPININIYGTVIALALLVFLWLVSKHPRKEKLFAHVDLIQALIVGILLGIVGARTLYVLYNIHTIESLLDIVDIWNGGLWVLGGILSILLFFPIYLYRNNISILPFADLISIHAGLLQGIARLGCFFAGCCYGKPTTLPWAITYYNSDTFAPCGIALHPSQLYSSALLLLIFCFMYFFAQYKLKKAGQLTALYLLLISLERFFVDFLRDDRELFNQSALHIFSINQWICLIIATAASIGLWYFSVINKKIHYT